MPDGMQPQPDTESLRAWTPRYFAWMRVHNYAQRTVERAEEELGFFLAWCDERAVTRPEEVSKAVLEAYQRHLFYYRKKDGQPLRPTTQKERLSSVKGLFKWLTRQNVLFFNPAAELMLPRQERTLPKEVLSAGEVDAILDQADVKTPKGLRDRAMMEVLYSTGMRRCELVGLDVFDLDFERGTVLIRLGKGKKDRVVPLGQRALSWVGKYLEEVRPGLTTSSPDAQDAVFLSMLGKRLTDDYATNLVGKYIRASGLRKKGSCHLLRHSMATLMLQNGADVRVIQEILGHESLETTQVYLRVAVIELIEAHAACHPAAGVER